MTKQFFALHCARYNAENVFEEYVETVEVSPSAGKPRHFFATNAKWGCSKDYPADPRSVALNLAAENAASVRKVEELPTYEAFETAARAAHERRFAAKGEAYATAEEMTYHREYPLGDFDAIEAEVCLELGARLEKYGRVRYMSPADRALFERQLPAPAPAAAPTKAPAIRTQRGQDAAKRLAVSYEAFCGYAARWEAGERSRRLANSLCVWSDSLDRAQKAAGVELRTPSALAKWGRAGDDYLFSPAAGRPDPAAPMTFQASELQTIDAALCIYAGVLEDDGSPNVGEIALARTLAERIGLNTVAG